MSPVETARFRELLVAERERITHAIAGFREDNQRTMKDEAREPGGVGADTASITFERELDQGLEEGAQQTLAQIEQALVRLDEGTYGTCERCGIGDRRGAPARPPLGHPLHRRPAGSPAVGRPPR